MKRLLFAAGLAALIAATVGCGSEESPNIVIHNDLESWEIYFVFVSPVEAEEFGDDLLGDFSTLGPGEEFSTRVEPGTYDIRVVDEDEDSYTRWGVEVGTETYTWNVTLDDLDTGDPGELTLLEAPQDHTVGDGSAPIAITNGLGSWDIYYVYVSPSDATEWGDERLGQRYMLGAGQTVTVMADPGTYDMQVRDEDEDTYTLWQVDVGPEGFDWNVTMDDLDTGGGPPASLSEVPSGYTVGDGSAAVTITNGLGEWDIYAVLVSPSTDSEWNEERLGEDYLLGEGQSVTVMVDPGTYDMQMVDEDGDTYTRWEVEVGTQGYDWEVALSDVD
jgi:hypothetical protein